jgi:uncharacterized repeat protein (TIGR01451 family)/LPXTG-motif cell wall-anchored protein
VRTDALGVGESATIELTVDVLASAYPQVVNTAHVGSPAVETDDANNDAQDPGVVTPTVALELDKSAVSVTGHHVAYRLRVTNRGPSTTVGPVNLSDPLPEGLRLVSAEGDGWSCSDSTRLAACTYAEPIAVGASAEVRLVAEVVAAPGTEITNVGTVSGGGSDVEVSDDAEVTVPEDTGVSGGASGGGADQDGGTFPALPDTGGPALWILLAGLLLTLGGVRVLRRRRG